MRAEMLDCLHRAGFPDITYAHIPIFRYEGPVCNSRTVARQAVQLRRCGRTSISWSGVASPSTIADSSGSQRSHSSPPSMPA